MIMPAPKKPMPVTTCAAIRVASLLNVPPVMSLKIGTVRYFDNIINKHEARHTIACVRMPASLLLDFLSNPIARPQIIAMSILTTKCHTSFVQSTTAQLSIYFILLVMYLVSLL